MRLYRTLADISSDVWEYSLGALFKHVVADLTLVDSNQIAHRHTDSHN